MSLRARWILIAVLSIAALGATTVVGVVAWARFQAQQSAPSAVATSDVVPTGDRIVFRNTASGDGYGHVASVPLDDPTGARTVSDIACDRVDATTDLVSCLRIVRGIAPTYTATLYSAGGEQRSQWPLSGIPSRTRISGDGDLIATTAFVTGHSYATIGFSTETKIHTPDGDDFGNLEEWTLIVDGEESAPVDRNYWGVTFIDDDTFYATAGMTTMGKTYLVRGEISTRTLTTLADNVECPSLSPDGTRIAFKRVTAGSGPTVHWTPAIYDIASGDIAVLPEKRSIDDQVEWLDDETVLYGMPREGVAGDTDVWALAADGSTEPKVFIEHAWSPSVVHTTGAQ
ncbi:hypothetical protein [Microbacterium invictum]|uniref:TolB-like translocation protein signal peptide n=1 Tax=Microbacterium invictum TaxID=515415 RepID=A0AA40SPL7_9MICO|nr:MULTISPECIES: hypothetical protein [Microbacterium]MBB4140016.1 hypothetical protein [Microbacterium invictum]